MNFLQFTDFDLIFAKNEVAFRIVIWITVPEEIFENLTEFKFRVDYNEFAIFQGQRTDYKLLWNGCENI